MTKIFVPYSQVLGDSGDTTDLLSNASQFPDFRQTLAGLLSDEHLLLTPGELHTKLEQLSIDQGHCPFYKDGCSIYRFRPEICRIYICGKLIVALSSK